MKISNKMKKFWYHYSYIKNLINENGKYRSENENL